MKFKKLIFSLFLFMGALLVVSSSAYAETTSGVDFIQTSDKIYVGDLESSRYNSSTNTIEHLGMFMEDLPGGYFNFELIDAPTYDVTSLYTFNIYNVTTQSIEYSSNIIYEVNMEQDSQSDVWITLYDINGSGVDAIYVRIDEHYQIYWEIEETDSAPVFDGQTVFVTTIDNPIAVSTVTSYITAFDETDGNVSHNIELVDSARDFALWFFASSINQEITLTPSLTVDAYMQAYDDNTLSVSDGAQTHTKTSMVEMYNTMGLATMYSEDITTLLPIPGEDDINWTLAYYVKDSADNYAALEVKVIVKDVLGPTWNEAKDTVSVSYTETLNIETYKTELGSADNYYDASDLTITIDSNTYTANKTSPGSYEVVYKILDPSNNYTLAPVTIDVFDDVDPVFSGPTVISKSSTQVFTLNDIKSELAANDAIDGNLTSSIQVVSDNYTGYGNIVGSYDVEFSVTDSSGNIAYHTITVDIYDNLPPIFYVKDGYFVTVVESVTLTQQDFIDILEVTGQIAVSGTGGIEIYTLLNEYEGNESTPGIYALSFRTVSLSGDESVYNMAVEVMEDNEDPIDVIEDEDGFDFTALWDENKTYIIGGLIILAFGGLVFMISKKTKRHIPKKKKYKKVRK
jgi:hypothetical protein